MEEVLGEALVADFLERAGGAVGVQGKDLFAQLFEF